MNPKTIESKDPLKILAIIDHIEKISSEAYLKPLSIKEKNTTNKIYLDNDEAIDGFPFKKFLISIICLMMFQPSQ